MEATVTDSDKGNKLIKVMFDKENLAIPNIEFWSIGHQHCFVAHSAAKHPNCVGRTGIAFDAVCDLERYVSVNVALRTLAFPNRFHVRNRSLKNQFRLLNQLLKSWRDYCRRWRST